MSCRTAPIMRFKIYTINANQNLEYTGKMLSISQQEAYNLLMKYGNHPYGDGVSTSINENSIVLALFEKIYGFTEGFRGHTFTWDYTKAFQAGTVRWQNDRWKLIRDT